MAGFEKVTEWHFIFCLKIGFPKTAEKNWLYDSAFPGAVGRRQTNPLVK